MNKHQESLIDFIKTGEIEIELRYLSQKQLIRLVEDLQQRIDKALKDIEGYKKMFNLNLFSTALENIEAKLRGEE